MNFGSQSLEGRDSYVLHFGFVTMIVVLGGALFPWWGWLSTAWVLRLTAVWRFVPPLWQRFFGEAPPSDYLWHGDDIAPPEVGPDQKERRWA